MNKALNSLRPDWTRIEASSADEALTLIKQSAPDIVLIDFNMPGKDGRRWQARYASSPRRSALQ